jgi:hypothetical protein
VLEAAAQVINRMITYGSPRASDVIILMITDPRGSC